MDNHIEEFWWETECIVTEEKAKVICPLCGTQWEVTLAMLTCPCRDEL